MAIYTMSPMADDHRSLRAPHWLWAQHEQVVGNHTADLKLYLDWRIHHPDIVLGPDVQPPHDFLAKIRVEQVLWDAFLDTVPDDEGSSDLRRYIWWRIQNPDLPLPGRRLPPLRRSGRHVACV